MKKVVLWVIKVYQKTLSYDHGYIGKVFPNTRYCKFVPTCSEYTYTAVDRFGVFKGLLMGFRRFLKCNRKTPAGTYDPVPENK